IDRFAVLHADNTGISFRVNVLEHPPIVDLSGGWLVPSRNIADLEIRDLVPGGIDVRDDVAFRNLLMVDVEQYLARRAVYGFADHVSLRYLREKHARMIDEVQRLQHHDDA